MTPHCPNCARLTSDLSAAMVMADKWRSLCERATAKGEELVALVAELSGGIVLRGWHCASCRSFNSSEKEDLTECRSCGRTKAVRA